MSKEWKAASWRRTDIDKEVRNETTPSQDLRSLGEGYFDFEAFL